MSRPKDQPAVIRTGPDGKIRFINESATALTGWRAEDAAGQELGSVFRLASSRRPGGGAMLWTRDDRCVPIEGGARALEDGDGRIREILVHFSQRSPRRVMPAYPFRRGTTPA